MSLQDLFNLPTKSEYTDHRLHAYDDGSTEMETLLLLYSLIRRLQPSVVVETGTYKGFGTAWMAQALLDNCPYEGHLWTYDKDPVPEAMDLIGKLSLAPVVKFITKPTQEVIFPTMIDFIFHDADKNPEPFKEEMKRSTIPHLRVGGLAVIHDANKSGLILTVDSLLPATQFSSFYFSSARGLLIYQRVSKDTSWVTE